jgi:hypothetical protein
MTIDYLISAFVISGFFVALFSLGLLGIYSMFSNLK